MAVLLTWRNWWAPDAPQNIYRSDQPFTRANLPAVYDTVDPGVFSYEDLPAEGVGYWYAVGASFGGVEIVSDAKYVISGASTGSSGPTYLDIVARYWRINKFATGGRASARECHFLDGDGVKLPGTLSASSARFSNVPSRAYDDDPATIWQAGTGDNQGAWFAIDLGDGNDARVDAIYYDAYDLDSMKDGFTELEYSDDGSTWVSLGTISHSYVWGPDTEGTIDVSNLTRTEL
ncbi:hypothetical protein GQE99_14430 [Maritimibacter sp. DP07]|uniref:F5/8 type C domain-containing protein n=1 Tax=Maritimibacter harenae TaxID=2606218 RepID=A0A845M3S5_9RHOB|nr:discoidin domain-containing protein [Maritimibacter harenae]MZR14216.1 hypothetical protein [Maritimibacter harenae]